MGINLKSRKTKFIVAGILILGGIGYLVYTGIRDTSMYYMTPSEVIKMGEEAYTKGLRLGGFVADGSIQWDPKELQLEFQVIDEDGKARIPVVYQGVVPDTFENGIEIVVEGSYLPGGIFKATTLLPKCPSKYEPEN